MIEWNDKRRNSAPWERTSTVWRSCCVLLTWGKNLRQSSCLSAWVSTYLDFCPACLLTCLIWGWTNRQATGLEGAQGRQTPWWVSEWVGQPSHPVLGRDASLATSRYAQGCPWSPAYWGTGKPMRQIEMTRHVGYRKWMGLGRVLWSSSCWAANRRREAKTWPAFLPGPRERIWKVEARESPEEAGTRAGHGDQTRLV